MVYGAGVSRSCSLPPPQACSAACVERMLVVCILDRKPGGRLLRRGHLLYFHLGRYRIGQDGALYEYYLLPIQTRCCCGGVKVRAFRVYLPQQYAIVCRAHGARAAQALSPSVECKHVLQPCANKNLLKLLPHCMSLMSHTTTPILYPGTFLCCLDSFLLSATECSCSYS